MWRTCTNRGGAPLRYNNHNFFIPIYIYIYIYAYLGFALLPTTSDNDYIIFCGHNNFLVINFLFSEDKIL
jgi:hypothetical protein